MKAKGKYVLVRGKFSGVFVGELDDNWSEDRPQVVRLDNCRRIWRWTGAFTLSELGLYGPGAESRLSEPYPSILILDAIEILSIKARARKKFVAHPNDGAGRDDRQWEIKNQ